MMFAVSHLEAVGVHVGIRSARAPIALLLVLPLSWDSPHARQFLVVLHYNDDDNHNHNTSGTPDQRADELLAMMTQAEKLQMVQGGVTTNLTYGYTVHAAQAMGAGKLAAGNSSLVFADAAQARSLGTSEPATACPRRSPARPVGT